MRKFNRSLLCTVFFAAISLVVFLLLGKKDSGTWATLTALLAVVAAVISAWPALRVLELQEDSTRPYPFPYFDITSRYSLLLLKVKNLGPSVAYDVRLTWTSYPLDEKGQEVSSLDLIPVLLPGSDVSAFIGRTTEIFKKYPTMHFEGSIEFKDATLRRIRYPFVCSADEYRKRLVHDEELTRTLYDLQQIPEKLSEIARTIRNFQTEPTRSVSSIIPTNLEDDVPLPPDS